jgi:hypothetical protein
VRAGSSAATVSRGAGAAALGVAALTPDVMPARDRVNAAVEEMVIAWSFRLTARGRRTASLARPIDVSLSLRESGRPHVASSSIRLSCASVEGSGTVQLRT